MGLGLLTAMAFGCGVGATPPAAPGSGTALAVSPQAFSFGDVPVGTSTTRDVTLSNRGTAAARITDLTVTGPGFSATGLPVPLTLAPGASTTLTVGFAPPATGTFAGDVTLVSAGLGQVVIAPTGTGVMGGSPPAPRIDSVTVNPATVAASQAVRMTAAVAATGTIDTSVTWAVAAGSLGSIDPATGVYTAPSSTGTYTVTATSVADTGKKGSGSVTVTTAAVPPSSSGSPWFVLMHELYGDAGATAQQRMSQGLLNGATFHPSLTTSEQQFLTSSTPPPAFAYFAIPAEANVASCYPSSVDANAGALLANYTRTLGSKVWRLGMPEFDQGGGCWASGRPSPAGSTDAQAYAAWTNFYLNTKQLGTYLGQGAAGRGYKWMSVSSFAFSVQYALDMGADTVLLERNEDEMSGITPGLAMIRGAAAQHGGKEWGIDFSTWRYWNNGPTSYSSGKLVTGWSTSTFKRNLYISYMGGANMVHLEAADFTTGALTGSSLNPLGQTVQEFDDFAVRRHPNRGMPYVPMALMQGHYSGFEPKFGEWMQGPMKWYWTNSYTPGDRMFANLLDLVYPSHSTWGRLPNGAPKVLNSDGSINVGATQTAYRQALATGVDPRPWEPMGNSQWGETFDVITDQASLTAMQRYKVIVLATGAPIGDPLLTLLTQYVQQGGTLVINAQQVTAAAETLTGVHLTSGRASATAETWLPDGSVVSEPTYNYTVGTPTSAAVIAQAAGNPIVTRNAVGAGAVYFTTPDFLSNAAGSQVLNVARKLLGTLQSQVALVQVEGPQLEYLVTTDGGRIIVTLVNTDLSGAPWSGTLSFSQPASSYSVKEWTGDTTVASSVQAGKVVVSAAVPAFDVRIYVLDSP